VERDLTTGLLPAAPDSGGLCRGIVLIHSLRGCNYEQTRRATIIAARRAFSALLDKYILHNAQQGQLHHVPEHPSRCPRALRLSEANNG